MHRNNTNLILKTSTQHFSIESSAETPSYPPPQVPRWADEVLEAAALAEVSAASVVTSQQTAAQSAANAAQSEQRAKNY